MEISKQNSTIIRGIAAIGIVLTHLNFCIDQESSLFLAFSDIGYLLVGLFYYYTGFNSVFEYKNKGINKFYLVKKIKRVYLPFIISNIILIILKEIKNHWNYFDNIHEFVMKFFGIKLMNIFAWYVISVIIFYIVFFVFFMILTKILRNNNKKLIISITSILVFVIFAIITKKVFSFMNISYSHNWYMPLSLIVGMLISNYHEEIKMITTKYKYELLLLLFVLAFVTHSYTMKGYEVRFFGVNVYKYLAPLFFSLFVNGLTFNVDLNSSNLKAFSFFGEISFEMYITHYLSMYLLRGDLFYIESNKLFVIIYFISTIILSILIKKTTYFICSIIGKV